MCKCSREVQGALEAIQARVAETEVGVMQTAGEQ